MSKVYIIEYVECDIDGMSSIEKKAFSSYRLASQHLLDLGYKVEPSRKYDFQKQDYFHELKFEIEGDFESWVGNIHELDLT